jgi:hypothetical protein
MAPQALEVSKHLEGNPYKKTFGGELLHIFLPPPQRKRKEKKMFSI